MCTLRECVLFLYTWRIYVYKLKYVTNSAFRAHSFQPNNSIEQIYFWGDNTGSGRNKFYAGLQLSPCKSQTPTIYGHINISFDHVVRAVFCDVWGLHDDNNGDNCTLRCDWHAEMTINISTSFKEFSYEKKRSLSTRPWKCLWIGYVTFLRLYLISRFDIRIV
jgi:hypothetical protein